MAAAVYIGLVHHPIYNKKGEIVTTAVTNYDIHDICRTGRTYEVKRYFLIHPLESQVSLVEEIRQYWQSGYGGQYNPDRREAFSILDIAASIDQVVKFILVNEGCYPIIVTTDARKYANTVSYENLRSKIDNDIIPVLLLFGTGWGIEKNVMEKFDYILEPIYGRGQYNHLPVRAAVAVILDRLLGQKWWNGNNY